MTRVVLVRHAMPVAGPDLAPSEWPLTDDGCAAARGLRDLLPADAVAVSSPETKALSTLALAIDIPTTAIRTDPRLAEVGRPGEPFDDDAVERRGCWVAGRPDERHHGWETPAEAAHRFGQALDAVEADRIVVGTHGMVATAWLVSVGHLTAGSDARRFWGALRFPDIVEVDLDRLDQRE